MNIVLFGMEIVWGILLLALIAGILAVVWMFVVDYTQRRDAVRQNYPVIGRFRNVFTKAGEFFRQYFFALDREEMPFNRAHRNWIEAATHGADNTIAFGSTKPLNEAGAVIFVSAPFPQNDTGQAHSQPLRIGEGCRFPYDAPSFFNISAMSYGALSPPAITALSAGAAKAGCWLNTGEGGLAPAHLAGGCDIVFQIGTAKYGVRDAAGRLSDEKLRDVAAHGQVRMFEIKLSQGAKPGKGGILPGIKVNAEIAGIRGIPEGKDSISPNRHPEIANVGDLLDMIGHIRDVTGKPVGFKTVISDTGWIEELFDEVERRGIASAPDFITVDGGDGGTGAAPQPLMDNVGLTLREALPMVSDVLHERDMRGRVRLIAAGKLLTPASVAWALGTGADFVNTARGFMFSLGCIQAVKCNRNTCPTGITTNQPHLTDALDPTLKSVRVAN